MGRYFSGIFTAVFLLFALNGCSVEKTDDKKVSDLEFSVLEENQIPPEFMAEIELKKTEPFKLSFSTKEGRYIAIGYGRQATNGYSITVEKFYLSTNAVYIKTNLLGPLKGEMVSEVESFPYIVVKTSYMDKNIIFE